MNDLMSCGDVGDVFEACIDGSLPPGRQRALGEHLERCRACARALREAGCVRRLLRRMPREPMPDPLKTPLIAALRRSRTYPAPSPRPLQPHDS
jgi:anti-sigma factor RsiW